MQTIISCPKGSLTPTRRVTVANSPRTRGTGRRWISSRRGAAETLAAALDGTKLAFERRASEKNVLFGSVTVADISQALAEIGFDLDSRCVMLEHPIKELGLLDVVVHIHREIDVTIPVRVVRPGEDPDALAPEFVAEGSLEVADEDLEAEREPVAETGAGGCRRTRTARSRNTSRVEHGRRRSRRAFRPAARGRANREPSSPSDEGPRLVNAVGLESPDRRCRRSAWDGFEEGVEQARTSPRHHRGSYRRSARPRSGRSRKTFQRPEMEGWVRWNCEPTQPKRPFRI